MRQVRAERAAGVGQDSSTLYGKTLILTEELVLGAEVLWVQVPSWQRPGSHRLRMAASGAVQGEQA